MQLFELRESACCSSRSDLDAASSSQVVAPLPAPTCLCCGRDAGGGVVGQEEASIPTPAGYPSSTLWHSSFALSPILLPCLACGRGRLDFSAPHGSDFTCGLEKRCCALPPVPWAGCPNPGEDGFCVAVTSHHCSWNSSVARQRWEPIKKCWYGRPCLESSRKACFTRAPWAGECKRLKGTWSRHHVAIRHASKLRGNSLDNRRTVPKQMAAPGVAGKPWGKHLTAPRRKLWGCELRAAACWGCGCERHGCEGWPRAARGGVAVEKQPKSVTTRSPHSCACQEGCQLHQAMGRDYLSGLLCGELKLRSPRHKWPWPRISRRQRAASKCCSKGLGAGVWSTRHCGLLDFSASHVKLPSC